MKYIRGFDGLRAISILLVLLTHLGIYSWIQNNPFLERNYNLFSGKTGVMIFFTISGFLITSLLLNEKLSRGRINFKNFFIRRFLRLLPPLLVFFTIILILMICNLLPADYTALLISFFYMYNFVEIRFYTPELGHTWSLGVEEQFYLIWPFVISGIKRYRTGFIFSGIIISLCIIVGILYPIPIWFGGRYHEISKYYFVDRWFIPACLPIMIGALSSMVLFNYQSYLRQKFYKNHLFVIISLLFFSAQLYIPHLPVHFTNVFQPVGISLLLLWIYFNQESVLVNVLEFKPISFLGKISYGVYVYQGLYLRNGPGGKLGIQHFPLNICLLFATATLSYFMIEKRVMKYKKRFKI